MLPLSLLVVAYAPHAARPALQPIVATRAFPVRNVIEPSIYTSCAIYDADMDQQMCELRAQLEEAVAAVSCAPWGGAKSRTMRAFHTGEVELLVHARTLVWKPLPGLPAG